MSDEEKESLEIDASDGKKDAIVEILDVAKQAAEMLPDDRQYDISIEYEEVEDFNPDEVDE